jgi:hypothetical protein
LDYVIDPITASGFRVNKLWKGLGKSLLLCPKTSVMHWILLGSTTPYMPIVMQSPVVESVMCIPIMHPSLIEGCLECIILFSLNFHAHEFEQSQPQYMYFVGTEGFQKPIVSSNFSAAQS